MTVRADRLTPRATTPDHADSVRPSYAASSLRVFVDALERLHYRMEPLLAHAGVHRADLDDPDARIPRSVWGAVFRRALEQCPMKNAGMRLATVTPFGAFPLIDYLIATSQNVGEGLTRLGRYLRLAEARSLPNPREEEDPIRVVLEGCDTPFSAEFTVTLNLLHFVRKRRTDFAPPTSVSATSLMMSQRWNGCSVVRCTQKRPGTGGR
jgi:Arabinose-binding domain of AraC transcription regulator, N-term